MPPEDSSIQVKCLPFQLRAYYVSEFSIETLSARLGRQMNDMTLRSAFRLKMKELEANEQANTYLNLSLIHIFNASSYRRKSSSLK